MLKRLLSLVMVASMFIMLLPPLIVSAFAGGSGVEVEIYVEADAERVQSTSSVCYIGGLVVQHSRGVISDSYVTGIIKCNVSGQFDDQLFPMI